MQIDKRDFQKFSQQINNDDKIIIDQFKATISMIDNELKISNTRFSSPFLKADIKADILVDMNNPEDTWIKSSTVKLDVLSSALERLVFELERELLGQALPRKGKSIVIEANGPVNDLNIKNMDIKKLMSPYHISAYASEARTVMSNINNASKMYYQTRGEWPTETNQLEQAGQLDISRSTKLKWTFDIQLNDQGGRITATSTEEMSGGAGHQVVYDADNGKFRGYGSPEGE
jgi:hypothetical protein